MSAMDDIQIYEPRKDELRPQFGGLRDMALALCLAALAALGMQAINTTGAVGVDATPAVVDWKGNSGSLR